MKLFILFFVFVAVIGAALAAIPVEHFKVTDISDNGYVSLMNKKGEIHKLKLPTGDLGVRMRAQFKAGKQLLCFVAKTKNGEEKIINFITND